MENTAIERYGCGNGDGMMEDNEGFYMSHEDHLKVIEQLQAKHEEELTNLESMVKEAINLPKGIEPHSFSDYKTKFKTKEL